LPLRAGWAFHRVAAALLAGAVCLALRLLSVHYGWQLPKVIA